MKPSRYYFVKVVFLPKFSLLSLGLLTGQYKTRRTIQKLIVSNHTQNFRNNKDRKVLKLQFENLRLLSIYRRCFSFFTVDDWLKLFHKLTTDEVQGTGQNLEQELFNHKNTYKIT